MSFIAQQHASGFTRISPAANSAGGGFVQRLCCALVGAALGACMLAGGLALLSYNEHRSLAEAVTLSEGARQVLSGGAAVAGAAPGALVHVSGAVHAETLADGGFGMAAAGLRLTRAVEMWQLREHVSSRQGQDAQGRAATISETSYSAGWEAAAIDSSRFADARFRGAQPAPGAWPVERAAFAARRHFALDVSALAARVREL